LRLEVDGPGWRVGGTACSEEILTRSTLREVSGYIAVLKINVTSAWVVDREFFDINLFPLASFGCLCGVFGAPGADFGLLLTPLGALGLHLGVLWVPFGSLWLSFGVPLAVLGHPWDPFGAPWATLRPSSGFCLKLDVIFRTNARFSRYCSSKSSLP